MISEVEPDGIRRRRRRHAARLGPRGTPAGGAARARNTDSGGVHNAHDSERKLTASSGRHVVRSCRLCLRESTITVFITGYLGTNSIFKKFEENGHLLTGC
jgi:hypothetical protein